MNDYIVKVLVVDDELPIREELKAFPWEKYGCNYVGEAANGQKALELCLKRTPDIIITDITMPVMDGLELIKKLKEELPEAKSILLTCHKDFEYAKKAIEYDVVDYLLKSDLREESILKAVRKAKKGLVRDQSISVSNKMKDKLEYRYEVRRALEIVEQEYASSISLTYVAEKVGLSPQYLSRLFREEVGEGFNDYLSRTRMENAHRFVLHSNLKVYQIAEKVGIPNYRYFSFLYKKWFSKSPKESKCSCL